MQTSFSHEEAQRKVGCRVEAVSELPSVPAGARGRVVRVRDDATRGWIVSVQWDSPRKRSMVFALLGEFSFNLPWRSRAPIDEFSKAEFERSLKPLDSANGT